MTKNSKSFDAVEQLVEKRGPAYMRYLVNSRSGFLKQIGRLEAEIIRLQNEEAPSGQDS